MMKLIVIFLIAFPFVMTAQMTFVPDDNFEQALIDLGYDKGPLNDSVPTKNINNIQLLSVSGMFISDLKGIEDFKALEYLICNQNLLTGLDLSKNTALLNLQCHNNKLTSLILGNNPALGNLHCYDNQLSSLVLSNCIRLKTLLCYNNRLSNLDISSNLDLITLWCFNNQLTSLDLSNNSVLNLIQCYANQLTSLDISKITYLSGLDCSINMLSSLDVSNNPTLHTLNTKSNPQLYCIKINDSTHYERYLSWEEDLWTIYSEDCGNKGLPTMTFIPDDNFEQALIDRGYDENALNDSVPTKNIVGIAYLYIDSLKISDLTGIENFSSLKELYCNNNELTNLVITNKTVLEKLNCSKNKLTSLNISGNKSLEELTCNSNELTGLDITNNTLLQILFCYENHLTSLDLSNNSILMYFYCSLNELTNLDITNNTILKVLDLSNNLLASIDMSKNIYMNQLLFPNNYLISLDLSQNTLLKSLNCNNNQLTSLDLSNNTQLIEFNALLNPYLTCIQVPDSTFAANNPNWKKDKGAVYSEDCSSVGVDEGTEVSNDITISPNPAGDYIHLNLERCATLQICGTSEIRIFNNLGECVLTLTPALSKREKELRIDVSQLAAGVYFVRIANEVNKFIKI